MCPQQGLSQGISDVPSMHPLKLSSYMSPAGCCCRYEEAVSECQKAVRVLEDGAADGQNNPNVATALCLQVCMNALKASYALPFAVPTS